MHAIQQQYWAVRDYLSPVLKESKFKEHGRITPEEFVAAGDFLTYKFPVWIWQKGDASKARDYLPADKQYLVTRGVPCLRRATSLAYTDADEDAERLLSFSDSATAPEGEEWVETHSARPTNRDAGGAHEIGDIPDLDGAAGEESFGEATMNRLGKLSLGGNSGGGPQPTAQDVPDLDEIPDMEEDLEGEDEATAKAPPPPPKSADKSEVDTSKANLLQVRTYDVMITYDKYYQTPRVWLLGYDEKGTPLVPTQIFQDVSADHAFKTVTIEPFPHSTSLQAASVHPCKHASVMKKVIERMNTGVVEEQRKLIGSGSASGSSTPNQNNQSKDSKKKWLFKKVGGKEDGKVPAGNMAHEEEETEGMRVDFYLVVFLKFIASIVPTIEVDSTTSM